MTMMKLIVRKNSNHLLKKQIKSTYHTVRKQERSPSNYQTKHISCCHIQRIPQKEMLQCDLLKITHVTFCQFRRKQASCSHTNKQDSRPTNAIYYL